MAGENDSENFWEEEEEENFKENYGDGVNNTRGSIRGKFYFNWPKICHGRGRVGQSAQHPLLTKLCGEYDGEPYDTSTGYSRALPPGLVPKSVAIRFPTGLPPGDTNKNGAQQWGPEIRVSFQRLSLSSSHLVQRKSYCIKISHGFIVFATLERMILLSENHKGLLSALSQDHVHSILERGVRSKEHI
ncbi:hypothetical protein FF38_09919 [Lucilia cuprina]|uniref:Uncharacterized protein n=1 Tax=Lucilia cuprina TaxID=7375 RepID=A0A0L0CD27_LUCCU|nr:hypothetical protein FF38_09919 [Lucilia cuprina]